MNYGMHRSFRRAALAIALLGIVACTSPHPGPYQTGEPVVPPITGAPGDRRILAGAWEYEDGAVVMLSLDEQGNGPYAWKDGRFETRSLNGRTWEGIWLQRENDREGGFAVELSADLTEGEGRWWYTRIGNDHAPTQKGGTFHLTKKSLQADSSQTPPAP